ncbi:MAG: YebC/PmpR family DNA-binding transcriptional regulator [Aureliella sp.]
MAGHSHWAGIKHKKKLVDAKRSKLWAKLSKAIIVAAKLGGGDPDANARLRNAIQEAKSLSLPKDNIERAIKKGTGEIDGGNVEETVYEGYGPEGVAIMCDIMTDNRNRTAPEVRKIFDVHGGNLGGTGCVAYLFDRRGVVNVLCQPEDEEPVMELALEQGAEDVESYEGGVAIFTSPEDLSKLAAALEASPFSFERCEVARLPQTTVDVSEAAAERVLHLLEALEDHDDIQGVATNLNFEHPAIAKLL